MIKHELIEDNGAFVRVRNPDGRVVKLPKSTYEEFYADKNIPTPGDGMDVTSVPEEDPIERERRRIEEEDKNLSSVEETNWFDVPSPEGVPQLPARTPYPVTGNVQMEPKVPVEFPTRVEGQQSNPQSTPIPEYLQDRTPSPLDPSLLQQSSLVGQIPLVPGAGGTDAPGASTAVGQKNSASDSISVSRSVKPGSGPVGSSAGSAVEGALIRPDATPATDAAALDTVQSALDDVNKEGMVTHKQHASDISKLNQAQGTVERVAGNIEYDRQVESGKQWKEHETDITEREKAEVKILQEANKRNKETLANISKYNRKYANAVIDPNRFMRTRTGAQKIAIGFGAALEAIGKGAIGKPLTVLKTLNEAIADDIALQQEEINRFGLASDKYQNELKLAQEVTDDAIAAQELVYAGKLRLVANKFKQIEAKYGAKAAPVTALRLELENSINNAKERALSRVRQQNEQIARKNAVTARYNAKTSRMSAETSRKRLNAEQRSAGPGINHTNTIYRGTPGGERYVVTDQLSPGTKKKYDDTRSAFFEAQTKTKLLEKLLREEGWVPGRSFNINNFATEKQAVIRSLVKEVTYAKARMMNGVGVLSKDDQKAAEEAVGGIDGLIKKPNMPAVLLNDMGLNTTFMRQKDAELLGTTGLIRDERGNPVLNSDGTPRYYSAADDWENNQQYYTNSATTPQLRSPSENISLASQTGSNITVSDRLAAIENAEIAVANEDISEEEIQDISKSIRAADAEYANTYIDLNQRFLQRFGDTIRFRDVGQGGSGVDMERAMSTVRNSASSREEQDAYIQELRELNNLKKVREAYGPLKERLGISTSVRPEDATISGARKGALPFADLPSYTPPL